MRAGVKFVATAIAVCLMVGVLMVGIFAASSGNMLVTSMVQWQSVGVEMDLHGKVSGNSSSDGNDTNYEDSLTLANDSKSSTWAIGTLSFVIEDDATANVRKSKPIIMRFGFTNTSTHNVNVYYYFASAPNEISNVTYEYQLAYGTLGSGETWESNFFSDSYSGNMNVTGASDKYYSVQRCTDRSYIAPGESAIFEIRMTVTILSQNISTATLSPVLKFQNTPMEAGTQNNPYIISDEEDYAYYATSSYMGNSNMYFLQTNDLAFNSVGSSQSVSAPREAEVRANNALPVINLLGHYDGGGNTIDLTGTNSPLFNNVGSSSVTTASLSDLNVYNENSTASVGVVTNVYGTLDGITFDGKIEPSSDYAGGIAMYNIGRIQNSINYADIVVTEDGSLVGGIAIWTERSATYSCVYFDNCINYGDFSGSIYNGGGIVCSGDSSGFYLTNCINVGNVISDSTYAGIGGLVGSVGGENYYYLESCYNSGSISAETTAATSHNVAGVIPGSFGPGVSVSITNCYNLGQVSAEGTAEIYAVAPSDINVTISNCYYLSTCGAEGAGTAISLYESQNIETWSGFDFDSTWEFASAIIRIDGEERSYKLPRLAFEKLEKVPDRSVLYNLNGTTTGQYTYYGAYPQNYVGNSLNSTLKTALANGTLQRTGWSYTTDINGAATTLQEYFYGGSFYAYLSSADPASTGYTFSTGETVTEGSSYFFKVEPLRWKNFNGTYLCEYSIASMAFDATSSIWAESNVRDFLNNKFYKDAGINLVKASKSIVQNNTEDGNDGSGTPTEDYIWLASYQEANSWFSSDAARKNGCSDLGFATYVTYYSSNSSIMWWLRTTAGDNFTNDVYDDGGVNSDECGCTNVGIRPCFIPDGVSGGGSDGNAYTIASAADYVKYATETSATGIGFANPDIAFKQTADITLAPNTTNNGYFGSTLLADYDGGEYTLTIDATNSGVVDPLFEAIGSSTATSITTNLKNLTINFGAKPTMGLVCRGLARYIYYTNVENVHTTGGAIALATSDLTSSTMKALGAIAYQANESRFIHCSNSATFSASGQCLGGLVGSASDCEFNYCWNTASISVLNLGLQVGGLVGQLLWYNSENASMKNCYNTGNISFTTTTTGTTYTTYAGGLVSALTGRGTGTVKDCYNTGNISGATYGGGLFYLVSCSVAGSAGTYTINIENCYNSGTAPAMVNTIGVANTDYKTYFTMTNCYNIASSSEFWKSASTSYGSTFSSSNCFKLSSSSLSTMQTQSTYTNAGWTFGTYGSATDGWVWRTASIVVNGGTQNYSLPRLWYEGLASDAVIGMIGSSSSGGNTDEPEVETYTIASASDFNKYAAVTSTTGIGFANPNIAFKQTADITSSSLTVANLAATYDGQNYTINTTGRSKAVFIEITGTLKNLTVRNTSYTPGENISTEYNTSGVAESLGNGGLMKNVHFTGTVSATGVSAYFGGLVEYLDNGTIDGCSNSATITISLGTSGVWAKAGGLVQSAWGGTIKNSWNTGAITAVAWGYEGSPASGGCYYNGYAGGLIAEGSVQTMKNCYNTGSISANGYVGGLIGAGGAPFENCYNTGWITSSGFSPSGGYTVYPQSSTFGEGGFIGSTSSSTFTNCFAAGVVTGKLPGAFVGTSSSASSITESGCYRLTSTNYNVPTDSYVSSTSRSHGSSGTAHTQSNWSWTFGTAGTATDGWVWVTDEIVINGEELTYALPRLWFEYVDSSTGGGLTSGCSCPGCTDYNATANGLCADCSNSGDSICDTCDVCAQHLGNICDNCGSCDNHFCAECGGCLICGGHNDDCSYYESGVVYCPECEQECYTWLCGNCGWRSWV